MSVAELPWTVLFLVNLVGSLAVTGHVLLNKKSPVSAAAWIGLAWFAPGFGALLYIVLGVNRVERRARKLARPSSPVDTATQQALLQAPVHLIPLDLAIGRITGRNCLPGTRIEMLEGGAMAYQRMLAAIDGAKSSLALTSYIFRVDAVGLAFIEALGRAEQRGVQVRVLIDAVGGGYPFAPAWRQLRARGVRAARFLHTDLPWRTPILNLRSHRKLMIVDGQVGFIGGLNIGADNHPMPGRPTDTRDLHFQIEGPIVAQAMAVFVEDWRFTTGEICAGPVWFPDLSPAGPSFSRIVTSGPDHELGRIKSVMMSAVGAARATIHVKTPYFLPDEALATSLALAAIRGVDVLIVLPARSDNFLVDWARLDGLLPLLAAGCRLRLSDGAFDHTKLLTIDGHWSLVGSSNWDQRSLRLNFEMDLEIWDTELADRLKRHTESAPGHAVTAGDILRRSLPIRLRDAAARLLSPYL